MALGRPVVPDEYSTHSGWPNGTSAYSGASSGEPGRSSNATVATPWMAGAAPASPSTMTTAARPGRAAAMASTDGRRSNSLPPYR